MHLIWHWAVISWFLSTSTLQKLTVVSWLDITSKIGAMLTQGPHQVAQKSTTVSWLDWISWWNWAYEFMVLTGIFFMCVMIFCMIVLYLCVYQCKYLVFLSRKKTLPLFYPKTFEETCKRFGKYCEKVTSWPIEIKRKFAEKSKKYPHPKKYQNTSPLKFSKFLKNALPLILLCPPMSLKNFTILTANWLERSAEIVNLGASGEKD